MSDRARRVLAAGLARRVLRTRAMLPWLRPASAGLVAVLVIGLCAGRATAADPRLPEVTEELGGVWRQDDPLQLDPTRAGHAIADLMDEQNALPGRSFGGTSRWIRRMVSEGRLNLAFTPREHPLGGYSSYILDRSSSEALNTTRLVHRIEISAPLVGDGLFSGVGRRGQWAAVAAHEAVHARINELYARWLLRQDFSDLLPARLTRAQVIATALDDLNVVADQLVGGRALLDAGGYSAFMRGGYTDEFLAQYRGYRALGLGRTSAKLRSWWALNRPGTPYGYLRETKGMTLRQTWAFNLRGLIRIMGWRTRR